MEDGEDVVDFLRKNLSNGKVGVHGESLGGMVASHLAKKCNL